MAESWYTKEEDFAGFFAYTPNAAACPTKDGTIEEHDGFEQMRKELAGLALLYDVPFSYLAPAEGMLKKEEIRFFHLDRNWIRALLDGAFSIGRHMGMDVEHDREYLEAVYDTAMAASMNVRTLLQNRTAESMGNALLLAQEKNCTGFLLRSQLVSGWRGLEFEAYRDKDGKEPLKALRLENLSGEVMIGLYRGVIGRLDVLQPPESFHFGFNESGGIRTKSLRSPTTGIQEDTLKEVRVYERKNRVVDFSRTAKAIEKGLGMKEFEVFTSAHMALQMIQNPYKFTIIVREE